tara:strand:+ start:223 stop:435 length:213 start_codon:yes stop_codon:yes gene_type:complete
MKPLSEQEVSLLSVVLSSTTDEELRQLYELDATEKIFTTDDLHELYKRIVAIACRFEGIQKMLNKPITPH